MIKERHQDFQISISEFRSLLTSHWKSHNAENRFRVRRFRPIIQDNATREALLDTIKDALGQYIHDDMLQSAAIVTGGSMSGFHIDDLLAHLLTIAFAYGAEHAANNFYECVEKPSIGIQFVTMIDGVKIRNPIEISDGIRLVPIPNDANEFPAYVHIGFLNKYTDYFGRTAIIVDELVSPVFARPDEMSLTNQLSPFNRRNVNTEYPNFLEREFCEALSLSTNHIVNFVSWWSHIDPDEAYAIKYMDGSFGYIEPADQKFNTPPVEINEQDVRRAMSLYVARKNLSQSVAKKLRVPIKQWIKSKTDRDPVDIFINLGTALESLYVEDGGRTEPGFKIAVRAAWCLGNNAQERISLKKDFLKIYELRSRAVHAGVLKEGKIPSGFTEKAQELCLKSITKIIQDGEFPDWDKLVMGNESDDSA